MNTTTGYVGLTDPDWYAFLASQKLVDEVNFWQPHGGRAFQALKSGDIFFFKLRAPQKAIAGFGFFERFETLPAWLAWECFGEMNGALDSKSMFEQIAALRGEQGPSILAGDFQIGCIMISAPVFFADSEWISPPSDWAKTGIQQGKKYDLSRGEGLRILQECINRTQTGTHYWNVDSNTVGVAEDSPRYGSPVQVCPRLGQGLFSFAVREAYGGACAITGEHSSPVLEAAHIMPYSQGGKHRVENGLLLRSDLHRLYDRGYVTVTGDYKFHVGNRLRDEFKNGRSYYQLNNLAIGIPKKDTWQPKKELLDWHAQTIFKG